jgi:hypothetical protein
MVPGRFLGQESLRAEQKRFLKKTERRIKK